MSSLTRARWLGVIALAAVPGCGGDMEDPGPVTPEAIRVAAASNEFAVDLYGRLAGEREGKNLFV